MSSRRKSSGAGFPAAALFNEINHGLGIQWNVTAASNYCWRGHEKYIKVLLAIMALCFKEKLMPAAAAVSLAYLKHYYTQMTSQTLLEFYTYYEHRSDTF